MMVVLAMARVAALTFWRDKAGLALAFVLPPVVFLVFAAVFGAGASGKIDVRAGVVDQVGTPDSRTLVQAVRARLNGRLTVEPNAEALGAAVASGREDAGLLVRGDLSRDAHPVQVLASPGKRASGEVLIAQVLGAANTALPRLMLARSAGRLDAVVRFTADQRQRLATASLPATGSAAGTPADARSDRLDFVGRRFVGAGGDPVVIYYAGAVSILFTMFTTMQGSASLVEERRAGVQQRLALSVGGVAPILAGRMLWLVGLGVLQSLAVFMAAALVYRASLASAWASWAITATAAAAASAGLSLGFVSLCRTCEQAQTVSTFAILILGAVGGSMAPRFLMPAPMQALGLFTPNAWAIDAYQSVLWRHVVDGGVFAAWGALAAFAAVGFTAAVLADRGRA